MVVRLKAVMKIGLIFPNRDRRYKTIHIGLASLAAYAREQHSGLEFSVLDTRVASKKETREFYRNNFDLVGITVFSPVYQEVKNIFEKIRYTQPEAKICLGGPYVTTIRQKIFEETPADFAVYGEGEISFSELISHLRGFEELRNINGLMYKNGDGVIVNPPREKIKDLDNLPIPAYDLWPMERYPLHRVVTGRGCPYACAWCNSSSIWDQTQRYMSPAKMVEEVEFLLDHYGKKIFSFGDNSFNADLNRVEEFCDLLIEKGIRILWTTSIRADNMTTEAARKMKKAGCYNVAVGIESANNEILRKMGKNTTIEKITAGIDILKEAGIEIMAQYVIGSPYDTLQSVKESIAYARQSPCDYSNFYMVLPFEGTAQWDYVKEHGKLYTEHIHDFHSIEPRIVFDTPEFTYEERLEAIRLVKKEGFYSNQDKKNWMFDVAKETSRKMQDILPHNVSEKIYHFMKSIYRLKLIKKYNP